MKPDAESSQTYTGHVHNGVIVLDAQARLPEGQTVRVQPVAATPLNAERAIRAGKLEQLFGEWTEEDGRLTDDEADRLRTALAQSRGLALRSPVID